MTELGHTVYQYCFKYFNPGTLGLIKYFVPLKAATHGSEMPYLFNKGIFATFKPNENDWKMIEIFTTYFANFAKYE